MTKTLMIPQKDMELYSKLLNMTGEEAYKKYGFKRNDIFVHTVSFEKGIEADIKLVLCEDECPYTEGVLFQNGHEIGCTEPGDELLGEYGFEYENEEYIVLVAGDKSINSVHSFIGKL